MHESIVRWFSSYLKGRYQHTYVSGTLSNCGKVVSGVPQGSVLATTLIVLYMLLIFLVYPHALSECIADMFADDSTISAHNKNIDKVDSTLSNELQRVDK